MTAVIYARYSSTASAEASIEGPIAKRITAQTVPTCQNGSADDFQG